MTARQAITNFLKRNGVVFLIGGIVLGILVVMIYQSRLKSNDVQLPTLKRLEPSDQQPPLDEVGFPTEPQPNTTKPPVQDELPSDSSVMTEEEVSKAFGTKVIEFTEERGFSPKDTTVYLWQTIKWVNTTSKPITLVQTLDLYPEWQTPFIIKPNEAFEFKVYKSGLWAYKEVSLNKFGTLFIHSATKLKPKL